MILGASFTNQILKAKFEYIEILAFKVKIVKDKQLRYF